jgi:hypothetical protein
VRQGSRRRRPFPKTKFIKENDIPRTRYRSTLLKSGPATLALAFIAGCGGAGTGGSAAPPQTSIAPAATARITRASAGTGTASSTAFASITNGIAWPADFRPYGTNIWNAPLPANPATDAANTANVRSYLNDTSDHITADTHNDYSHPVYFASAADPLVTINCSGAKYGCFTEAGKVKSLQPINVPAPARPAGGTDGHFAVIQSNGAEFDFWQAEQPPGDWTSGATIRSGIAVKTMISGSGVPARESATSGAALAAGLIRFDELARGSIPHAIFLNFACTRGHEYPATSGGAECGGGGGIPMGSLVHLTLTPDQIDALPSSTIAPALRPILNALHDYGGYVLDTYGGGSTSGAPFWEYESYTQYSAFGQPYPGIAFATANGYSEFFNPYPGYAGGPIRWSELAPYVEVLAPCYARAAC